MIEVSDTGVAPAGTAVVLIVNTCCVPTSFVAVNGEIETLASTYSLTAGPLPMGPAGMFAVAGLVSRVTVTPPMLQTAVAFNVNVPAVVLLIVTVHVRVFPLRPARGVAAQTSRTSSASARSPA